MVMKNDNYWKEMKAILKEQHKERVKKTPERIEYACVLLDNAGIECNGGYYHSSKKKEKDYHKKKFDNDRYKENTRRCIYRGRT